MGMTKFITIQDDTGNIEFTMLLRDDGKLWSDTQALEFEKFTDEKYWDNPPYIKEFLKGVFQNKKVHLKELKELCSKYEVDYEYYRESLANIWLETKQLKLWKTKN